MALTNADRFKGMMESNRKQKERAEKLWTPRKEEITWLYNEQEWTQTQIAERFSVSQATIGHVMKRMGIKTRLYEFAGKKNGRYKNGLESRMYRLMIQKDKCSECGATNRLAIHHKNGNHLDNHLENLQVLCWSCHNRKTKTLYWKTLRESGGVLPMKCTTRIR